MTRILSRERTYTFHFWLGLGLALFFWFASWSHLGLLGEYAFFPQWFGYILAVDGLVAWRQGTSLLMRAPREFAALFILSAPIWWIFEGLNNFVLNWHYLGGGNYSIAQIILISSIDFSTVIPAIFETTQLVLTFGFIRRLRTHRRIILSPRVAWTLMYLGAVAFAAVVLIPHLAFPLTWVWLVLLVDPLNYLQGRPSLLEQIARGDWTKVAALALAGTICGLFWEMWNSLAFPKWFYTVPYVGFAKIFEMPLLGYGGYWPFAWELYALYHLFWGVLHRPVNAFELE